MTSGPRQNIAEGRPEPPEDTDGLLDLNRAVGRQVKLLRERTGLTQEELGDRLGYGKDLVSSLEQGRRTPQRVPRLGGRPARRRRAAEGDEGGRSSGEGTGPRPPSGLVSGLSAAGGRGGRGQLLQQP
ncbi:helix-turn-helix transcriptional regulator [Streptomyces althioticus]|uniref:helix-turn-helix transcriptional regulator n=1 Tax=Streptomyces althioticus TaxID=83380 RepID=UPI0033F247DA